MTITRRHLATCVAAVVGTAVLPSGSAAVVLPGVVLPSAQRTVTVSNQSQLDSALASAVPGDHIVLDNGSYSGPGNWTKSGTQANPIVVRSATLLGARITGSFNPNGNDLILHGLDFQAATVSVGNDIRADRVRLWRCRWRDMPPSTSIGLRTYLCSDLDVAYCEWTNWGGRGISFGPAAGTRRPHVRHCLFRDTPAGFSQNATEAIQLGFGAADLDVWCEALIELCRFTGWDSDDETISVKSSGNTLRQLTIDNCDGRTQNRMGQRNIYEALWIKDSRGIRIHDAGNMVLGCRLESVREGGIRIAAGSAEAGTKDNKAHNLAADTVVSGCTSDGLEVGAGYEGHGLQVRTTRIRQHTGPIILIDGMQLATDSRPEEKETRYAWAPLVWLTNADVGPTAGNA